MTNAEHHIEEVGVIPQVSSAIGYAALKVPMAENLPNDISFSPNPAYARYLLMHKVIVGKQGAQQLEGIYQALRDEELPRYLSAAGSAAVEASLIRSDAPTKKRLSLLEEGKDCWQRALIGQSRLNAGTSEHWIDNTGPFRAALDIAVTPLIRGMILGYVPRKTCREVYEDCLTIAQTNAVHINLAARDRDFPGLADHLGLAWECNALLAFNSRIAGTRFAIPSMRRSDTGHHYGDQTHDLSILKHQKGELLRVTPVEVKATPQKRDKMRYKALLIRGKMHLASGSEHGPLETLDALAANYEGTANAHDKELADKITSRVVGMYEDYCSGRTLDKVSTQRSVTRFHDNAQVIANHPGLAVQAAA